MNGPYKTTTEIALTVAAGGIVNVDSRRDLDLLAESDPQRAARVGLRVNPQIGVYPGATEGWNAKMRAAARESKFGFSLDDGSAERMVREIRDRGYALSGLHMHLGSQIVHTPSFLEAGRALAGFAASINTHRELTDINFGGGMGVAGLVRERGRPIGEADLPGPEFNFDLARAESEQALDSHPKLADVNVAFEPGRAVVSSAMTLLTTVVNVKHNDSASWVVLDGGLNIMPTFSFGEQRQICNLTSSSDETVAVTLGGPLCYDGDVMMRNLHVPRSTAVGDRVLISDAGAYTVSRSTNFNRARAAVVAIEDDGWRTIWERERPEDVFAFSRHVDFDLS